MPNYRVYYPVHYVALGGEGNPSGATPIHGLQSVNTTTTFSLEQVFELGQLDIYENVENVPNVEMTLEKVLDGYPLIYHLATPGASSPSIVGRAARKCDAILSIFSDAQDNSSGTPLVQAYTSGMFVNSLNYTLPVQGQARESVTLVGNDKLWKTAGFYFGGQFTTGTDVPLAATGVQKRQNVKMGAAGSVFPSQIPGMTVANGSGTNIESAGTFGTHVQDVTISTSLGREDLFELGRRKPYYRYANFPVAVDCTINVNPGGSQPGDMITANSDLTNNLVSETIIIKLDDGTIFNLGQRNKLQSVTYSGGETGGGVATVAYAYQNFNRLQITHPQDPAGFTG